MENLTKLNEHIHRLVVPYKDIFTTVYIVSAPEGTILFDTASYDSDVDEHILPALAELGISSVSHMFISHNHTDHAGGIRRLLEEFPDCCIVSSSPKLQELYPTAKFLVLEDGDTLQTIFRVVTIPGHTKDSAGLLDTRSGILLTGDSLQLFGIYGSGKWGANISLPAEHLEALKKLYPLPLTAIYAAHDYHPCGHCAHGEAEIRKFIDSCADALYKIVETMKANPELDDDGVAQVHNSTLGLPTIGAHVVRNLRAAIAEGRI